MIERLQTPHSISLKSNARGAATAHRTTEPIRPIVGQDGFAGLLFGMERPIRTSRGTHNPQLLYYL